MPKKKYELIEPGSTVFVRKGDKDKAEVYRLKVTLAKVMHNGEVHYAASNGYTYFDYQLFCTADEAFKDD